MKPEKEERPAAPFQVVGGSSAIAAFAEGVTDPGKIIFKPVFLARPVPELEFYDHSDHSPSRSFTFAIAMYFGRPGHCSPSSSN